MTVTLWIYGLVHGHQLFCLLVWIPSLYIFRMVPCILQGVLPWCSSLWDLCSRACFLRSRALPLKSYIYKKKVYLLTTILLYTGRIENSLKRSNCQKDREKKKILEEAFHETWFLNTLYNNNFLINWYSFVNIEI